MFQEKLKMYGVFNKQLNITREDFGYWVPKMPGLGQINWEKFISELHKIGYEGVISIEHEDPIYEGSEEKVKEGLHLGIEYLKNWYSY